MKKPRLSLVGATASVVLVGTTFLAVACGPQPTARSLAVAALASETVGCASFKDDFFDSLYRILENGETLPPATEMARALDKELGRGRLANATAADRRRLSEAITELYEILSLDGVRSQAIDPKDRFAVLETLANLEVGDTSTPAKKELQAKLSLKLGELHKLGAETGAACAPAAAAALEETSDLTAAAQSLLPYWKSTRHAIVYGGLKAIATAYQSCEAGSLPALRSSTPDVDGVKIIGMHPNGVGSRRMISDLPALISSQPYLRNQRAPASSCFNVRAKPMIYDYGGKPATTSATDARLDFFKDAGDGTAVLGIDCSGYVFAALATAGLKVKKEGRLKAISVYGIPARSYMNPRESGLTCIDHVKFKATESLKPGDILASGGHVVIIESVGADPLGIKSISREADCRAENVSLARFDFNILQSSAIKGGIGIDRMRGADYLQIKPDPTHDSGPNPMVAAMIEHAVNACKARTRGTTITSRVSLANIVRHSGAPECKDTPVKLVKEECLATCKSPSLAVSSTN